MIKKIIYKPISIIIFILLSILLYRLNLKYSFVESTSDFFCIFIAVISLFIALQTFILSKNSIEAQNEIDKLKMRTETIKELNEYFYEIIENRFKRDGFTHYGDKQYPYKELNPGLLIANIKVLFNDKVYQRAIKLIDKLEKFDLDFTTKTNNWTTGDAPEILKKCKELLMDMMLNEMKGLSLNGDKFDEAINGIVM